MKEKFCKDMDEPAASAVGELDPPSWAPGMEMRMVMNQSEFRRNTATMSDAAIDMLRDRLNDMVQQLDAIQACRIYCNRDKSERSNSGSWMEHSIALATKEDNITNNFHGERATKDLLATDSSHDCECGTRTQEIECTAPTTTGEGDDELCHQRKRSSPCFRYRDQSDSSSSFSSARLTLSPPLKRSKSDQLDDMDKSRKTPSEASKAIATKQLNSTRPKTTGKIPLSTATSSATLPTEVLRQLLRSNFLEPVDIGRLLLETSKSIKDDIGNEYMYFHLCRSRWKNTKKIPPSVTTARGHAWLYNTLNRGLVKAKPQCEHKWPPLPPPKLTPASLVLLLNVWNGQQEMVSEALTTESLRELFTTGKVVTELEHPIVVGEFTMENNVIRHTPTEFDNWNATMQLVRLDTNQSCCVHESNDTWWYYDGDLSKKVGNLHLSPDLTGLELNDKGKALECRIREHDRMMDNQTFEGIYFEATMICSTYPSSDGIDGAFFDEDDGANYNPLPLHPPSTSMKFAFTKVKMEIYSIYEFAGDVFNSECEAQAHGVTALHLLDELRGWEE